MRVPKSWKETNLEFTGERAVPWSSEMRGWAWVMRDHVARYSFAMHLVAGRRVVDLGCGTGYGSFMMSWLAEGVLGCDVSDDAVKFAKARFSAPNLEFVTASAETILPQPDQILVSFEALEHLDDADLIVNGLWKDNPMIVSLPINDPGKFHKKVYTIEDIKQLMGPSAGLWYQTSGYIVAASQARPNPEYVVAVRGWQ